MPGVSTMENDGYGIDLFDWRGSIMSKLGNQTNQHEHIQDQIVGVETLSGVQSFVFAPGTTTDGNSYGTWTELYAAYQMAVVAKPNINRQIVFDPRGLVGGAPFVIPTITGVAVQSFENTTKFTSAENPTNLFDVETDVGVRMSFSPSAFSPEAIMDVRGLNLVQKIGDVGSLLTVPAGTNFRLRAERARLATRSAPAMIDILDGDFDLELVDADVARETAASGPVARMRAPVGTRAFRPRTQGPSRVERDTVRSDNTLLDLESSISPETRPASQSGLRPPPSKAFFAPSASDNNRPAPSLTVLVRRQLTLAGAPLTPKILQAFLFRMTGGVPLAANTFSITNGTVTETYTFVVAAGAPFEVTIGASAAATMQNLVGVINVDSVLWQADIVRFPGSGSLAIAIVRLVQAVEGLSFDLADRAFGTIAAAATPKVGTYPQSDGFVPLSYSTPSISDLPGADALVGFAGWSSVTLLSDKAFVTVMDDDTSGVYQVINPFGGGPGDWKYVSDAIDPTLVIPPGSAAYAGMRQTRVVRATLGAADVVTFDLPRTFQEGEILSVFRTDATAGVFSLVPVGGDTVNSVGAPFVVAPLAGGHGLMLVRDSSGAWLVVGQFP